MNKRIRIPGGGKKVPTKDLKEPEQASLLIVPETDVSIITPTTGTSRQVKRSGHLTDALLKYNQPTEGVQLDIFDTLKPETKEKIISTGVSLEMINRRGKSVSLTSTEYKLIDCLSELLHEHSQTTDPTQANYYTGNKTAQEVTEATGKEVRELVPYGGAGQRARAPKLAVTLYELTKKYKGGEYVSGKDISTVNELLTGLTNNADKRVLIRYTKETKNEKGNRVVYEIEDYQSLVKLLDIRRTEYGKEDKVMNQRGEVVILLNAIFRDQIETKYILFPKDITKRMIEAAGTHKIPEAMYKLRDYLARAHANKDYTPEIGLKKLYWTLADDFMKASKLKRVAEITQRAIEVVKKLGLLESHQIVTGKSGEQKVIFTLNKDWQ